MASKVGALSLLAGLTLAATESSNPCQHGCTKFESKAHQTLVTPAGVPSNDSWPYSTFKTSELQPPYMNFTGDKSKVAPGYMFLNPGLSFTAIYDNDGQLVYGANPPEGLAVADFRVQEYNGESYLTLWTGIFAGSIRGDGFGTLAFIDHEYNTSVTLNPDLPINTQLDVTPPGVVDIHEHTVTPAGQSIMITAWNNTPGDLSEFGIQDGWVADSLVYEIDIATQEVLFLWNAHDHGVPYNASNVYPDIEVAGNGTEALPWDWANINSATKVGSNYLISSRHLWTIWLVSGTDGSIIWELNGADGGDFGPLPDNATFSWQHYARPYEVTEDSFTLSIFNNHDDTQYDKDRAPTTGLLLQLNLPPNKLESPKVLRNLSLDTEPIYVGTLGVYTPQLSNGNAFMSYGQVPTCREYSPGTIDGVNQTVVGEWKFGQGNSSLSFRGFKETWKATPAAWDPTVAIESAASNGTSSVFASWNGATEVTAWNVAAGSSSKHLKFIGQAAKNGFETTFNIGSEYKCVQVTAVEGTKQVRKSNVACL